MSEDPREDYLHAQCVSDPNDLSEEDFDLYEWSEKIEPPEAE